MIEATYFLQPFTNTGIESLFYWSSKCYLKCYNKIQTQLAYFQVGDDVSIILWLFCIKLQGILIVQH